MHSGDDRDELRGGGRVGKRRAGRAFPSSFQSDARRIYDSLVELSARLASIMRPCRECCRELARALALSLRGSWTAMIGSRLMWPPPRRRQV